MACIGCFGIFAELVTQFMSTVNDPMLGISPRKTTISQIQNNDRLFPVNSG